MLPRGDRSIIGEGMVLTAQLEFLGNGLVAAGVGGMQIVQQTPALSDHDQQAATRAVILVVFLKMFSEAVDAFGENGNLDVCRTGVTFVETEILDDLRFDLHCSCRLFHFLNCWSLGFSSAAVKHFPHPWPNFAPFQTGSGPSAGGLRPALRRLLGTSPAKG